jgi:GNAT superfamily N-acetyltransferase
LGKALLAELARLAEARGCVRLDWAVLDWNAPSIAFYRKLGARALDEWTGMRLSGAELRQLAAS